MTNRFGVDTEYFKRELAVLSKSLPNRTPDELYRYLIRLANVAMPPKSELAESQNSTSTNKHMEQGLKSQIIAVVERRVNAQKMGYLDSGLERKLWDELRELLHV